MIMSRTLLKACRLTLNVNRQFSVTPVTYKAATATDPIQELFVDKIRAYAGKSKSAGGKLVDATATDELKYKNEIERVQKSFGATAGEDFTKFPMFNFQDTELEPVGVSVELKADSAEDLNAVTEEVDDEPWFNVN